MSNERNNIDVVTSRLCPLVTHVGVHVFGSTEPHDCFCEDGQGEPVVSGLILDWIEEAVEGAVLSHEKQEKAAL
jgi:hypothetical protein